jgi:hypothetical protein
MPQSPSARSTIEVVFVSLVASREAVNSRQVAMDSQVLAGKSALIAGTGQGMGMACARAECILQPSSCGR